MFSYDRDSFSLNIKKDKPENQGGGGGGGGVGKKHCYLKFFPKFQSALVKTMNMDYAIFMQI